MVKNCKPRTTESIANEVDLPIILIKKHLLKQVYGKKSMWTYGLFGIERIYPNFLSGIRKGRAETKNACLS
jgi:hypothetical protein